MRTYLYELIGLCESRESLKFKQYCTNEMTTKVNKIQEDVSVDSEDD